MDKALITGITGFAGSHLAELLLKEGLEVYGTYRWRSKTENIDKIRDHITLINADIRDSTSISAVIRTVKPRYIFHLAAQSYVPQSWNAPAETLFTNVIGTSNLLEAVRKESMDSSVQIAGSSEEYGLVYPHEVPITENNPLRPLSPYGVSKVSTDHLGWQYCHSYDMSIVVTRAFNHSGPRRGEVFATSNFAKQIAQIEKGITPSIIHVGNLEAKRDWTDVRDTVRAYWLAIRNCQPGESYNICTGISWSIREMLDILLSYSDCRVGIVHDDERMRPSDVPVLLGDCSKLKLATKWEPLIPFEQTMLDLLNYWRERV